MKIKRILSLLLAVAMTLSFFVSCGGNPGNTSENSNLAAPANVAVDEHGVVTWDRVDNAVMYYVYYGEQKAFVQSESFTLPEPDQKCTISVQAVVKTANGNYDTEKSAGIEYEPYVEPFDPSVVKIAITADKTVIKSGATGTGKNTVTFKAIVNNAEKDADTSVKWTIVSGKESVESSSAKGNEFTLTAKGDVTGDSDIIVAATSVAYPQISARKSVEIVSKPTLTQAMLDKAASSDKIGFEGYVNIDVYTRVQGNKGKLHTSQISTIKTSMSGESDANEKTRNTWSAEYLNGSLGITQQIYCRKDSEGRACEIGVSFMNEEQLYPVKDDSGNVVTWEESGYYNNFVGLSVSDFYLDEETWRYTYDTKNNGFDKVRKMIASANPYEFEPKNLELIIDGDEIIGISSVSEDSLSIVEGYISVQTLRAVFNVGDNVNVTTIGKFKTLEEYKNDETEDGQAMYERLSILNEAIENMRSLKSYKTKFSKEEVTSLGVQLTTREGYDEVVAEDYRYFTGCTLTTVNNQTVRNYNSTGMYGYKKIDGRTDIYNSFVDAREKADESLAFRAARAFTGDFEESKPSFAFSPEIFTSTAYTNQSGYDEYYFYADGTMTQVATTWYQSLGSDDQLYGIFAKVAQNASGQTIPPFIIVKKGDDGKWYIEYAAFYYDLGMMQGAIQIEFGEYNTAEIDSATLAAIDATGTRELPAKWNDLQIVTTVKDEASGKDVDKYTAAGDFMFGGNGVEGYFGTTLFPIRDAELPFFGDKECFGDTFAVGSATYFNATDITGTNYVQNAMLLWYDVPLDIDYTITSSLEKAYKFLEGKGFVKGSDNAYRKGNLCVRPVDSSLDLHVYVWTEEQLAKPGNVKLNGKKVSWDAVENATQYAVYVDGIYVRIVSGTEYTLSSAYDDGEAHAITIVAKADKYKTSGFSDKVVYKANKT
jgi:hypothetical protein